MADTYKCVDRAGSITYSDTVCPTTNKTKLVISELKGIKYTGEPITLNFYDVDLRSVFAALGDFTGKDIIVAPSVSSIKTTIVVHDMPWDQVIAILLAKHNLTFKENGRTLYIGKTQDFR